MTCCLSGTLIRMTCVTSTPGAQSHRLAGTSRIAASGCMCTTPAVLLAEMNSTSYTGIGGWTAFKWWVISFVAANFASSIVVVVTGHAGDEAVAIPIWVTLVGALVLWSVQITMFPKKVYPEILESFAAPQKWCTGSDIAKYIPLGIFGQLFLVNLVNWPLSQLWPDTFSFDEVSQRANDVTATAPGLWVVVLCLVVVIGAPVVEEIVYRGTLQPAMETPLGAIWSLVFVAALFAGIHLQPVEFPGLFAFALLLGVVRLRTGRLAPTVITHMAFNATGLVLVTLT